MQRIGGPFFKTLFMFLERFCQPAYFFAARFTLRRPKTPVRNATNLRTFCFSDYHYAFLETLCPVTLAHYRSLYFIQVYIFIPLIHSAPFLRAFHTFYLTPIFRLCILPSKIFFLSLMTLLLGI